MKVVILAGGHASTIEDGNAGVPKPMATVGEKPILWHVLKNYAAYGFKEFIICGGYKVDVIKDYFADFYLYQSDITIELQTNKIEIHKKKTEDWKVTIKDTGLHTATGKRVAMIRPYITEENFIVTYGDILSNINIELLVKAHLEGSFIATMAIAKPTGRNRLLEITEDDFMIGDQSMEEYASNSWTSAGTFVFNRKVFDYLNGDYDLGDEALKILQEQKEIKVFRHHDFYLPIETYRDKTVIEELWNKGVAPWKVW